MFRFLTVLFVFYYIYRFVNPFNAKRYIEYFTAKDFKGKDIELKTEDYSMLINILALIVWQIIEFLYLVYALNYDVFKYPTIAMLLWFAIAVAISTRKRKPKSIEEYEKFSFRLRQKFIHLLDICYFGYMFYLLFLR